MKSKPPTVFIVKAKHRLAVRKKQKRLLMQRVARVFTTSEPPLSVCKDPRADTQLCSGHSADVAPISYPGFYREPHDPAPIDVIKADRAARYIGSSLSLGVQLHHRLFSMGMGFRSEDREFSYIFVTTKLPEPEHPELSPTSVQLPVMVLFFTVPCRAKVLPLGLPDLTVS
jgi:hypothetical protein